MGPTCSNNFLRFANLTAQIKALQINILEGYPYDHPTMIDMVTRSPNNLAENLLAVFKNFEWAQIGAVLCEECYAADPAASEIYFSSIEEKLQANNIALKEVLKIGRNEKSDNISEKISVFEPTSRVLLLFLGNKLNDYVEFMRAMALKNLTSEEYTPVIVISKFAFEVEYPWKNDVLLAELFHKTIIIYNNCYEQSKISSFVSEYSFSSVDETLISLQMYEGYHILGYYLYSATINTTLFNYEEPEKAISKMDIHGPFGDIYINTAGQRVAGYTVAVVDKSLPSLENNLQHLGTVSVHRRCPQLACLEFALNSSSFEAPKDVPLCGFHGEICDQTGVIYAILVVLTVVCVFLTLYIFFRKLLSSKNGRSISNPWLIPHGDIKFLDLTNTEGSQHMSIQSLQRNMDEKARLQSIAHSKQIATVDQSYVLVDKFVMRDKIRFDRHDTNMLYQMKSHLQHDNLNGFGGLSFDKASHIFVIWTQCFRGSLHDHIFTKERRRGAGTNFEGAFLRDILKGLEYLHSSALEYHGNLTLHNCMLDSHWIVKLSGFGVNRFLVKWKANGQIFTEDHTPIIKSEELHYFDPEIKRIWKQSSSNKQEKSVITPQLGRRCDMYSFGVVLYEIYFKRQFVEKLVDLPRDDEDSMLIDEENDAIASKLPNPIAIPEGVEVHNDLMNMLRNCFNKETRPDVKLARKIVDTVLKMSGSLVDSMIKNLTEYTQGLSETVKNRTKELESEQEKNDQLLSELLPKAVANDLKTGNRVEAKTYKNATILYSDIVGFTSLCSESKPIEVVNLLSGMYQRFDLIISQQGGYKIETIGDAYCVAGGLPVEAAIDHVKIICMIALLQRDSLHQFEIPHRPGKFLNCRWGFNSGEVFSGVIGIRAPRYACFGEAVALASKMESNGKEDRIQLTLSSQMLLEDYFPQFTTSSRGGISIEGYGHILTYWLEGVSDGERVRVREFQDTLNEELSRLQKKGDDTESVSSAKPKDRMEIAKEKVMAEKKREEERLQRQQTLHEALEDHEEPVEMKEVLIDEDDEHTRVDLRSTISTPSVMEEGEDEENVERVIGHGRLNSQASTIPEN